MKPLIIFHLNSWDDNETVKYFEEVLSKECEKGRALDGYSCIVIHGDMQISVHYPHKPVRYYYNKIKAWFILKIWKRKVFSNTLVTL